MIIFGWGFQTTKIFGVVFRNICSHCGNNEYWVLTRRMTWFTLFFIPVFPYSIEYFLSCPICQFGLALKYKQAKELRVIAEANQLLIDGKISDVEYGERVKQLENNIADQEEVKLIDDKPLNNHSNKSFFCRECGKKLNKNTGFCDNCNIKDTK